MSADLFYLCLMGAAGLWLWAMGVIVADKQARVRWGNWLLPEARVPRVFEGGRRLQENTLQEDAVRRERFSAVFPLPTDLAGEHTEFGSREVRRIG